MLTLTEHLTWQAPLRKAARLFLHSKKEAASGELNDDSGDWQYVSGQHWWCKVLFTLPSKKQWPATMHSGEQSAGLTSVVQPAMNRQLRIIIESGSAELDDAMPASSQNRTATQAQKPGPAGGSGRSSSSRPWAHMVLDDVDMVRINQKYFHTNRRLDAVRVFHHDLQVGIWYLDEHDAEKSYRIQLIFKKEEDKKNFLTLVEPDSSVQPFPKTQPSEKAEVADKKTIDKKPTGSDEPSTITASDESSKVAALEQALHQSQSLADTLLQMAKSRIDVQQTEPAPSNDTATESSRRESSEEASPTGCPNCALTIQHEHSTCSSANGVSDSSYDTLYSSYVVSIDNERAETPLTNVSMEENDGEEYQDPGLWGWPNPRAVECIQDDVCRLCLADPNLEWIIARCVDEHFRNNTAGDPDYE